MPTFPFSKLTPVTATTFGPNSESLSISSVTKAALCGAVRYSVPVKKQASVMFGVMISAFSIRRQKHSAMESSRLA